MKLFSIISSHKKLYRKQPVEFLITEHVCYFCLFRFFLIRPEYLKTELLKGGTLLYPIGRVKINSKHDFITGSISYHAENIFNLLLHMTQPNRQDLKYISVKYISVNLKFFTLNSFFRVMIPA